MLTIFACPKAFTNRHIAIIQRNALISWLQLRPKPEVLLFGRDEGTADICNEMHVRHVPDVECNQNGTPLISDIFSKAQSVATYDVLCYINADIILTEDLIEAIMRVHGKFPKFLLSGQRWGLEQREQLHCGAGWETELRRRVYEVNDLHKPDAIDYFVFTRNLFQGLPEFAIGRPLWDNWLIGHALALRVPVIDASSAVMVVHQAHDYAHTNGWENYAHGPEALQNRSLVPRGSQMRNLHDATHALLSSGIRSAWLRRTRARLRRCLQRCRRAAKRIITGAHDTSYPLLARLLGQRRFAAVYQRCLPATIRRCLSGRA